MALPSTWMLFICDRKFSLFLYLKKMIFDFKQPKWNWIQSKTYHSLQMSHCNFSWTSWSARTWYLCIWILLLTLPHKSHTTLWSISCICRMCLAIPFDCIIFPHCGHGTLACLILCFSNRSAVANVSMQW